MKKMITILLVLMLTTALFSADALAQKEPARSQRANRQHAIPAASQPTTGSGLTDSERQVLILMREEEKLARDVYLAMQEKWGGRVARGNYLPRAPTDPDVRD